ncbi:MAG: sodium/solute symporter [Phycisphaerales bacterium]|nr:sodium/solute symporter [Phycisphaerales bacterium]
MTGILFSRRKHTDTTSYFLGGRHMPIWAVAISIVATSLSAVTFIGAPQQAFGGDLTYLATNIGMILAALLIAFFFIPVFYKANSASIYDLLERRFDARARKAASITFLAGRVLASGARVYVGAMPASVLIFGLDHGLEPQNLMLTIGALAIVGTLYTLAGGISSVIWSDVIQYLILVGAAITAIVLIAASFTAPLPVIIEALRTGGEAGASKLTVIDPSFDLTRPFTLPACIIGFTLLGIGSYGTDQDLAQRMLTCKSAKHGARSVIAGILLGVPTAALFLIVGLGLWIVYKRPELTGTQAIRAGDDVKVFLDYIMTQVPPGVRGLMMAGLFAAGLSSMNSAINAMGAAFVDDLYKPIRPDKPDKHYVTIGRTAVVVSGIALAACAVGCIYWNKSNGDTLINFALGTMAFAYAGLVGVFFTALFTKRGSSITVIMALGAGFLWMLFSQPIVLNMLSGGNPESPITQYAEYHFTWKLTVGVGISMLICMIGSPRSQSS